MGDCFPLTIWGHTWYQKFASCPEKLSLYRKSLQASGEKNVGLSEMLCPTVSSLTKLKETTVEWRSFMWTTESLLMKESLANITEWLGCSFLDWPPRINPWGIKDLARAGESFPGPRTTGTIDSSGIWHMTRYFFKKSINVYFSSQSKKLCSPSPQGRHGFRASKTSEIKDFIWIPLAFLILPGTLFRGSSKVWWCKLVMWALRK